MFSVDDLLLAHGYQLPRRSPVEQPVSTSSASSSCSDRSLEAGCRRSAGRDAVNVSQRDRDRDSAPEPALLPLSSQQTRLNSGLPLPCSSGLHSGKDINYWRRRGQDFSALLDYTNHGGSEGSNAAGTGNIPKAEQRGRGWQEHRLKSTQRRAGAVRPDQQAGCTAEGKSLAEGAVRGDMWGPPMDRKCQSLGTEEWRSSLGRQSSDSGGAKSRPNILPRMVSDEVFHKEGMEYVRKGKSQSLPRVTPDINGKGPRTGLHYVTTSGIDTDIRLENQCLSDRLVLQTSSSYCDPKTSSKWPGNVRQSSQFAQLPKAKLSRPLNPPSYELYQQIRRSSEMIPGLHVHGDNEGQGTDVARDNDHNSCPNLDNPPVYVPPSSCQTQPQRHVGRKCLVKVPSCHNDAGRCSQSARTGVDQPHWCCPQADPRQLLDDNGAKRPLLQATNATDETGNGAHPSRGSRNGHSDGHRAFVKYIPFTDPRIRHMTIVQSGKRVEEADCRRDQRAAAGRDPGGNGPFPAPPGSGGAFPAPPGSRCSGPAGDPTAPGHGRSLAASPENERSGRGPQPPAGNGCGGPSGQGAAQAATRVRTWAPGSRCFHGHGTKQRQRPRRRVAETIFCLVSVPLKAPEEDEDEEEDEEEEGASEDHSLSSSDLELQALTGGTTPANGPKGPRRWVGGQGGVASSFKRHRELGVSGSWPGDRRRDQQTQTSFGGGPRDAQLLAGALRKDGATTRRQQQSHSGSEASAFKQGGGRGRGAAATGDHPVNGHPPGSSASTGAPHTQRQVGTAHRRQPEGAPRLPCEKGGDARGEKDRGCPHAPSDPGVGAAGFGQFLLKPVARRPRDAISELENFNKEIQDREDPNTQTQRDEGEEGGEPFASRVIRSDAASPSTQTPLPRNPEPERPLPDMTAPGEILEDDNTLTPGVQKAHSVSAHHNKLRGQLSDPLCRPVSKSTASARRSAILNIFSSKSAQFTRLNREQNAEDPDSKTQCTKTNGLGAPTYQLSEREGGEVMDNNTLVEDKAAGKKILPAPETRSNGISRKMFFQFDTDQMSLEPDPSSFTSWESTKPTIDEASGLLKQRPVRGISKTESFEERAARILGIDVAVDALLSPVGMEQRRDAGEFEGKPPWVEELSHTCDPATTNSECASGEVLGGGVGQGVGNSNRLEWGDSPVLGMWLPNGNSALQNESPGHLIENGKGWQSRNGGLISEVFHEPFSQFYKWADRNCHFGTESKNTPLPGQDRKGRNTSGRIEALQGRLAAAPRHAAPGRLARMKEVDSVSRIRRLRTKSTDPADEPDEAQCSPEQGDREGPCTPARMEDTRATETRVPSRGEDSQSFVPSIAVSTGSKEAGDAYDPSKVETV